MRPDKPHPIYLWTEKRLRELDLSCEEAARRAGVSRETFRRVRKGLRDSVRRKTGTERRLEEVLRWEQGSFQSIRQGGEPTPLVDGMTTFDIVWPRDAPEVGYPGAVEDDPHLKASWDTLNAALACPEDEFMIRIRRS